MLGTILAPPSPRHKNRPNPDNPNCKIRFLKAHCDHCRQKGGRPVAIIKTSSKARQVRSIVTSLSMKNSWVSISYLELKSRSNPTCCLDLSLFLRDSSSPGFIHGFVGYN